MLTYYMFKKLSSRRYTQFGDSIGITTQYKTLIETTKPSNLPKYPGIKNKLERILKSAGKHTNKKISLSK